ncbi:uncharacterized protein Dwil_GK15287 [Drosophila willistoni]|uniref:Nuclear nucleic acid-binding protein C1D n=1 Tax=Drosophila willistoni TaxID=7260 RepID=B4NPF6_DROWI|nr:uncharacterized protein LOC6653100 [Drosophila willistoni]EDW86396.1 uncharacterized protein Dwil_GK15287 [Drosophila willistoni]
MKDKNQKKSHSTSFDLDEKLKDDTKIRGVVDNFAASLDTLEIDIKRALSARSSPTLSLDDQIKLDTFLTYANSTLYWMHLKLQGTDVSKHPIIHDLNRAKEMLARDKEINASLAAPRLDMPATKRFIAAGMHTRFVDMDGVMVTEEQYKRSLKDTTAAAGK